MEEGLVIHVRPEDAERMREALGEGTSHFNVTVRLDRRDDYYTVEFWEFTG